MMSACHVIEVDATIPCHVYQNLGAGLGRTRTTPAGDDVSWPVQTHAHASVECFVLAPRKSHRQEMAEAKLIQVGSFQSGCFIS